MNISKLFIFSLIFLIGCQYFNNPSSIITDIPPYNPKYEGETIKIANWNLQIFGDLKASNSQLMAFYASVIDDYDIVFIQEIRDEDSSAYYDLCTMLDGYKCKISSRAGRSTSKEQYGVFYKKSIEVPIFFDFNNEQHKDDFERPPIRVQFVINNYSLAVYNIHIKPDDVAYEMQKLEELISPMVKNDLNAIILGDMNAACSYYNNDKENHFDSWRWIIKDDDDTTVSSTNCAYDRIIMNDNIYNEFVDYGIYREGINKNVSDHYLVWVEVSIYD